MMSRFETRLIDFRPAILSIGLAACLLPGSGNEVHAAQAGISFAGHVPARAVSNEGSAGSAIRITVFTGQAIVPVAGSASAYAVRGADGAVEDKDVVLPNGGQALIFTIGPAQRQRYSLCRVSTNSCSSIEIVRLD